MMNAPHWELSVLARAIAFPTLSSASDNIGISQPQLSRIVSKIEAELGLVLLNRASRRKSGWTPLAVRLAEAYTRSQTSLAQELRSIAGDWRPEHLRVAALEGLVSVAASFCHALQNEVGITTLELNVHDLNSLEEHFLGGDYELIFASRVPGRSKPRYTRRLGYQLLERVDLGKGDPSSQGRNLILSSFEHQSKRDAMGRAILGEKGAPSVVSNSLALRRHWVETYGGVGVLPSAIRSRASGGSGGAEVLLIGSEVLSPQLWERSEKILRKISYG